MCNGSVILVITMATVWFRLLVYMFVNMLEVDILVSVSSQPWGSYQGETCQKAHFYFCKHLKVMSVSSTGCLRAHISQFCYTCSCHDPVFFFLSLQAEEKNAKMQELNRFVHYYTRFKNHENSYKVWHICTFWYTDYSVNYVILLSLYSHAVLILVTV